MKTHSLTEHSAPAPALAQSLLKVQSTANKASSSSFAQYLAANLSSARVPSAGVARQSPVTSQNSAVVTTASQTPAQLASQLLAQNSLPPAQPTEPVNGPLYSGSYMQELTYNGFVNQANLQNQNAAAQYQLDMSNWALNETQRDSIGLPSQPPPTAPQYVAVNSSGFNQWWSSLSNYGDPAPVTFINPIPEQQSSTSA